jgi:hypothetical protein
MPTDARTNQGAPARTGSFPVIDHWSDWLTGQKDPEDWSDQLREPVRPTNRSKGSRRPVRLVCGPHKQVFLVCDLILRQHIQDKSISFITLCST